MGLVEVSCGNSAGAKISKFGLMHIFGQVDHIMPYFMTFLISCHLGARDNF